MTLCRKSCSAEEGCGRSLARRCRSRGTAARRLIRWAEERATREHEDPIVKESWGSESCWAEVGRPRRRVVMVGAPRGRISSLIRLVCRTRYGPAVRRQPSRNPLTNADRVTNRFPGNYPDELLEMEARSGSGKWEESRPFVTHRRRGGARFSRRRSGCPEGPACRGRLDRAAAGREERRGGRGSRRGRVRRPPRATGGR
jgi:hypothetical protein